LTARKWIEIASYSSGCGVSADRLVSKHLLVGREALLVDEHDAADFDAVAVERVRRGADDDLKCGGRWIEELDHRVVGPAAALIHRSVDHEAAFLPVAESWLPRVRLRGQLVRLPQRTISSRSSLPPASACALCSSALSSIAPSPTEP